MDQSTALTVRDHMMLELEQSWWTYAESKDATIRELFSMTPTRYYVVLHALIGRPGAETAYPLVVRRLRRLRETRRTQRSGGRVVLEDGVTGSAVSHSWHPTRRPSTPRR